VRVSVGDVDQVILGPDSGGRNIREVEELGRIVGVNQEPRFRRERSFRSGERRIDAGDLLRAARCDGDEHGGQGEARSGFAIH
jgi:hypothetical protein